MNDCNTMEAHSRDLTDSGDVATLSWNAHLIARYLTEECSRQTDKNGDAE